MILGNGRVKALTGIDLQSYVGHVPRVGPFPRAFLREHLILVMGSR